MIRHRLVVAVSIVAAVAVVLSGWLVLVALERRLVDNLDRDFRDGSLSIEIRELLTRPRAVFQRPEDRFDPVQRVAVVRYDADGHVVGSVATGTDRSPDPLPDGSDLAVGEGLHTVGAVDGNGPSYRAAALAVADGGKVVIAVPLSGIEETVRDARRILVVLGFVATAGIAAASWMVIRRGLAPLDHMVDTAGRIADGDLTERVRVSDTGTEVGRLGTALDTMLDRIQEAVDAKTASEARMRDFVAEASHELRTPLTSVRGYAELFRHGRDDPEVVRTAMERIESEASRMQRLVDQLLLLARLDRADRDDPSGGRQDAFDLGLLVGEAVDAVRIVDPERTWDVATPDRPTEVLADRDRIRQVVDNLLTNCRAHTPPGTTVTTTLTTDGPRAVLVVADDGPGVRPADRDRVFDRFWRGTRTDENPVAGTGLGLAIVREIIRHHGGDVWLSDDPGGGSRFVVELPLRPPDPTPAADPTPATDATEEQR